MASLVVQKGPAQQIAGTGAPSNLIRNLDANATLYVGTTTNVSSTSFDMVLEPGAAYSTPPGPVYVCTTAAAGCAIVYSPSGSGLVTPGPTTVNANINGTVPIAGNVGVPAGVGVNGNVNVKNLNQWDLLQQYLNYSWLGSTTSGPTFISGDISKYATLAINYQWGGSSTVAGYPTIRCRVRWIDASGTYVLDQTGCTFGFYGLGVWQVPIRGTYAQVDFYIDKSRTGNVDLGNVVMYIGASLDAVPERYVNDPNGYQANIKLLETVGGAFGYSSYPCDLIDGNAYNFQTPHSQSARVVWELPSIAGPMQCMFFGDNLASGANYDVFIGSVARGKTLDSHDFNYFGRYPQSAAVLGRVSGNWSMIAPKKPLVYDLGYYGTAPSGTIYPTLAVAFGGS